MAERQLTRKQLGQRYGVARNTIYLWVQQGVLPDSDVHFANQHRWSENRLADWERKHLTLLTLHGVDVDRLPQFAGAAEAKGRTKPTRGAKGQAAERGKSKSEVDVFTVIAKARARLIAAMAKNKRLTSRERQLTVSYLKEAIALLGR